MFAFAEQAYLVGELGYADRYREFGTCWGVFSSVSFDLSF